LKSVEINFNDKIRALVLLSSRSKARDSLVMVASNYYETGTLKFDDAVCVFLSEEARRKSSGLAETSRSAPSVDRRGRLMNREKKNGKSKSKSGREFQVEGC